VQVVFIPGHAVPGNILTAGSVEVVWTVGVDATWRGSVSEAVKIPRLVPWRRCTYKLNLAASSNDLVARLNVHASGTC